MKKFLAILIALILVSGVMFAEAWDDSTSLTINTSISGKYGLKISETAAAATTPTLFDGITEFSTLAFTDELQTKNLYVHTMTNKKLAYTVTVTAYPLAKGTTSYIGYTVTPTGQTAKTIAKTDTSGVSVTLDSIADAVGLRIKSNLFTIAINATDWLNAEEGDHTTTWTVNFTAQ